jgi:acyl transferase domain-containing protein
LLLFQVSSILQEKLFPQILQQYLAVVIGASGKDYARLLDQWVFEDNCTYTGIGNELSVLGGRISYTFNCKSKCLVIDTACSSSLVGVHVAKEDCVFGYSKGAISAGASVIVTSELHKVLGAAGMLSICGRCKTLEASADGYSRSECVVTVLLVNASAMLVEGDKRHPILIGSSVNQDGRSSSLTAPNGPSQHEVIKNSILNTDGEDSR